MDVLKIQTGVAWHKQIAWLLLVTNGRNSVVAGSMAGEFLAINCSVIHHENRYGAARQFDEMILDAAVLDVRVRQTRHTRSGQWMLGKRRKGQPSHYPQRQEIRPVRVNAS